MEEFYCENGMFIFLNIWFHLNSDLFLEFSFIRYIIRCM